MPARIRVVRWIFPDRWLWVCDCCNPPVPAGSHGRAETISAAADAGRRHLAAAHTPTWACVECGGTFGSPDHPCTGNGPQSPEQGGKVSPEGKPPKNAPGADRDTENRHSWADAHRENGQRG